jgi:glycosyltransferase involved in cell wall biosynthesis
MSTTIGIDASSANKQQKTGIEWYAYHLIRELAKIDQKNTYKLYANKPLTSGLLNLGKNFHEVRLKWPFKYLWLQGRLSLEMLFNPPDILLVPAQPLPMICPRKSLNTIHDLGFKKYPEAYAKKYVQYLDWSIKHALKKAQKIIAISDFTKQELIKIYQAKEEGIVMIPLGYDEKFYYPIKDLELLKTIKEKYDLKNHFLLYLGRLEKKKNIITLIKAFELLLAQESHLKTDLQLVLVGKAGFGYQEIKEKINSSFVKDQIKELGWIDEKEMPSLLGASKIFIFPSLYEGFGLPIVQAMACGVPVIASDIPALKEVGEDACLYFSANSPEDLKSKIQQVLENQSLREKLINHGFLQSQKYSWQRCAARTLAVVEDLYFR